jgi:hypothetical protein
MHRDLEQRFSQAIVRSTIQRLGNGTNPLARSEARSRKLTTVPLIIRDLTDEEMVGFMGRENMEDFNSDFLVMLRRTIGIVTG